MVTGQYLMQLLQSDRTQDRPVILTLHRGGFLVPTPDDAAEITNYFGPAGKMAAAPPRPFDYLESLPSTVFNKLYQQPSTALAIFRRMLPDLGTCLPRHRADEPFLD